MAIHVTSGYTAALNEAQNCSDSIKFYSSNKKLFYTARYRRYEDGNSSMVFECLRNYHPVEGDFEMFCVNNTFVGREPRCEVDPFMKKTVLATFIGLISFIIPAIWLAVDLGRFVTLRYQRRLVSFQPYARVDRITSSTKPTDGRSAFQDIMEHIRTNPGREESFTQFLEQAYGVNRPNYPEEAEDIFQNKTLIKFQASTNQAQAPEKEFQLLGAARVFGKIGKALEKNLF